MFRVLGAERWLRGQRSYSATEKLRVQKAPTHIGMGWALWLLSYPRALKEEAGVQAQAR